MISVSLSRGRWLEVHTGEEVDGIAVDGERESVWWKGTKREFVGGGPEDRHCERDVVRVGEPHRKSSCRDRQYNNRICYLKQ